MISDLESTDYTLPKFVEGQNPYLFRMTWTKAKYFSESESPVYVGDVVYEVEVDLAGNEFENPRMIFSTQGLYMDVYEGTLRTILSELAGESKEESQVVGIRIKTTGSGLVVYSGTDPAFYHSLCARTLCRSCIRCHCRTDGG